MFYSKNHYLCDMNNRYHRDIMEILLSCGREGMKLRRLAAAVYNRHVDIFERELDYESLHRSLGLYLWRQSHRHESPFRRNAYGIYSIKPDVAVQLDLFWNLTPAEELTETNHPIPANDNIHQLEFWS